MSFIKSMFVDKATQDNREVVFAFSIPSVEGSFGLFAPDATSWKQLIIYVLLQSVIQCAFAVVIYKLIVQKRGTASSYLLGWGLIVPLALYLPFWLLEFLDTRNRVINLSASTVMTVIFFRCMEAMYDTSPLYVELSLENYVAYYSSAVPFVWDPQTKARKSVTLLELLSSLLETAAYFTACSLVLSFLMHFNYKPFDSPVELNKMELSLNLLSPAHIGNAYFHALLVYCTLKTGFDLTAVGEQVKGVATKKLFDSPLISSRSPTEFWTKRWNLMTQQLLKGGVFLPARRFFPARVSVFMTFAASGLYHDYVWRCIFMIKNTCMPRRMDPAAAVTTTRLAGSQPSFSLWELSCFGNGPLRGYPHVGRWLPENLPTPLVAHLYYCFFICLSPPIGNLPTSATGLRVDMFSISLSPYGILDSSSNAFVRQSTAPRGLGCSRLGSTIKTKICHPKYKVQT